MCQAILHLLLLMTLSRQSLAENETNVTCPDHQRVFGGSCFKFVGIQRSFFNAEAWCEENGGHLAFIPDEDTQGFLQRHMDTKEDVWFGVAASAEGRLSWLDGSPITYSKWASSPQLGSTCGYILRDSGFHWEATNNCSKKQKFICEFESGKTIVCEGHNTTLQCGPGQVLMIDGGFYGRKSIHYCRSKFSPPTSPQHQCGWVDAVESITAHCHGRQVCQVAEVVNSFAEPCPQLKSYLSVDYHCKDGLLLSMNTTAAVFDDVRIQVKWLVHSPLENLNCRVDTGDDHVIYLNNPKGLESSVVHKYLHPSTFIVTAECTSSEMNITGQKIITIQEPVAEISVMKCYAGNLSFSETTCKALYGEAFQIQMQVKAGTNVVYTIKSDEKLLAGLSVVRGTEPHNITITSEMVKQLGSGCHHLTLYASNTVTLLEVSKDLQVCILEKIAGLQVSVLTASDECLYSPFITFGVSLERGEPVLLLFFLIGDNSSFAETRQMNTRKDIFQIEHPVQGSREVKLTAGNVFSSLKVVLDISASCSRDLVFKQSGHNGILFGFNKRQRRQLDDRNSLKISVNPSASITTKQLIILSVTGLPTSSATSNSVNQYQWQCKNPCKCQGDFNTETYIIQKNCLPDPFEFNKYYFNVVNNNNNDPHNSDSICITVTPSESNKISLTCTEGCDSVQPKQNAKITMQCTETCPQVVWSIEDSSDKHNWPSETMSCYDDAKTRPLVNKQTGGNEFYVDSQLFTQDSNHQVTVVVTTMDNQPLYKKYTIQRSSSSSPSSSSASSPSSSSSSSASSPSSSSSSSSSPSSSKPSSSSSSASSSSSSSSSSSPSSSASASSPSSSSSSSSSSASSPSSSSSSSKPSSSSSSSSPSSSSPSSSSSSSSASSPSSSSKPSSSSSSSPSPSSSSSSPSEKPTQNPGASTNGHESPQPGAGTNTATATAPSGLSCSISPQSGTVLSTFSITCNPEKPCSNCQYCFKTQSKKLQCSQNSEIKSIFLPPGDSSSNYNLNIIVTATNRQEVLTTTITAQVQDSTVNSNSVENTMALLKAQGQLSVETTGLLFSSVANNLNSQTDPSGKADRQTLREKMLDTMANALKTDPTISPQEAQVLAGALGPLVKTGAELSTSAQEGAALLFANLSSSLLHMEGNASEESQAEMLTTASMIVEGLSNILDYSSNMKISDGILDALNNIQSALLLFKQPDEEPTIIQQTHINVLVRRVSPTILHTNSITITNCSCPAFSLPKLPCAILPSEEPVDVRMLSFDKNPFSWKEGSNISGFIGSLSLSTKNGPGIPVENLSEDIQILLPRPAGEQVNTSVLYLGNFSTTVIDIPSAEATLVLKMMPSKDPLPFKVLLDYNHYPTETNYVAATEMPHQGATPEEKYTWMLHPADLKGNTGVHYLVVRPIVGPGIKSVNASLSITPITALCKFWNESQLDWSNYGCRVGVNTTRLETQCLCNHLTFFGSSFFVTPNLVDPSRTAELFATFANNPVVVCFVGALSVAYLLVVVWARRKDVQDKAKVKVTVLEDNDPMDEYRYLLSICTGHRIGASTSSQVTVTLLGTEGNSEPHHLTDSKKRVFEKGAVDMFLLTTPFSLGDLQGIRLWHNNSGSHPAWYVGNVMVQDLETKEKWHFLCNSWLSIDIDDCSLDKVFPVSTETDLKGFSNLFFMKTTKDFKDGHLWYSVISRPPSSNFTCVQRVSCCFSLLLCTMLTSIMFYGIPTDPSEQTMDMGAFQFTWQQFMIGVESSLIVFPVNILIVGFFRFTRPRETSCCQRKSKKKNTQEQTSVSSQTATMNTSPSASLDVIIKDITKIANSLSKMAKSNVPCKQCEFEPGQQNDVNAILSVVKDFIKQNDNSEPKTQTQVSDNRAYVPSASAEGVIQKKSNKAHYLYRQLCHIDSELSQLGHSSFPDPHSYEQALQQVRSMKSLLEDQLFTSNSVSPHELTNKTASPSGSSDADGSQKKGTCCHRGLPWWFVFVGWLLVVATSVISGYFTMLYGLKYGKARSISWLVSMSISFFQSILLIQPLKVLCIAIFFALIIKKVDEEDFQNVPFERNDRNIGDSKDQQIIRQRGGFYEPPHPADIERMRRNMIMEQKAFALLREILIYIGFLWMLLLVAHGQRDPNAFYLNTYITEGFCGSIQGSMSHTDIFTWANTTLLTNLFGVYPGFITDGNSKLVGNARLRQLRVQKKSCQTAGVMLKAVPDCNALYSWDVEDMGSYEPGWNKQAGDNISTSTSSPWKYQTETQLRAYPSWGKMVLYRGGGFAVELGPDLQNASSTLEDLFSNKWLDMYTRAVFVEFTVYNANVNLFCIVTLLLETTAVGAFRLQSDVQSIRLYPSSATLQVFVMTAEIIYMLFVLYYMFIQGKLMKQQRWLYFKIKWNLLDLTLILLSWSAVAVFIKRTVLGNRDITYYQNHKDKFASFYETATADSLLQYVIAFLVLLATIKLWHLLRLNPKMNMMTAALQRACASITGLLVILALMMVAYSIACNLIYGATLSSYKTFVDSLMTIISLQIGIFNYDEILDNSPLLGGLLIGSCIVFMTFVVLSLLFSVIMEALSQEKRYNKPSEEDEILDLLLRKICSLFGIRSKRIKDTQEPGVNGSSVYSRNILSTSTPDANVFLDV